MSKFDEYQVMIPTYLNVNNKLHQLFPNQRGSTLDLELVDTTDDAYALYQWARYGGGVTMMLDLIVQEEIEKGNLIHLFPEMTFSPQNVYLLFNKSLYQTKKTQLFRQLVREYKSTNG